MGERERRWVVAAVDEELSERLAAGVGCPLAVARILVGRGIVDAAGAGEFLNPSMAALHDPGLLLGMREAVARIQAALRADEPILIYGDYDVDGTTATVLLKTAIERVAPAGHPAKVTYHVPHRIREGYGMQGNVLGAAAETGIRLVISVDTGIRAFAAAAEAAALGLDLIVTDHHLPDEMQGVPEALAVINPAQTGCGYPNKMLCGAAVAFKLAQALMEAHADAAEDPGAARERLRGVVLPSFLKLVAIATIADAVPLVGENRAIAALGLRELRNPVQAGLRALMEVAGLTLDAEPTAMEVGFRLGPRINAAGRMDIAADVVELFLTRDAGRARELAEKLDRLNGDRRATEAQALAAIEEQLAALRQAGAGYGAECIILDDPAWHRGVLGILASRVVERTGRPALVLTHQDGTAHGSGRSIAGFHLLDALTAVHEDGADGLFTRFGGHAHAVGLTLPMERMALLRSRMRSHAALHLTVAVLEPPLVCDAELALGDVTEELLGWMERLGPFGSGACEPLFLSRGVVLAAPPRIIKGRHVSLRLGAYVEATTAQSPGAEGTQTSSSWIEAVGWSRAAEWVERCAGCDLEAGCRVDVAYRVRVCHFGGVRKPRLELAGLRLHPGWKPLQAVSVSV